MNEIDRILLEGFETTATKDVDSGEVWWKKGIANKTQMAGKLV